MGGEESIVKAKSVKETRTNPEYQKDQEKILIQQGLTALETQMLKQQILQNAAKEIKDVTQKIPHIYTEQEKRKAVIDGASLGRTDEKYNIYYSPIVDAAGKIVNYEKVLISKENSSEIIRIPVKDIKGNIVKWEQIINMKPLETPLIDPIDVAVGIFMIAKSVAVYAIKTAGNASVHIGTEAVTELVEAGVLKNIVVASEKTIGQVAIKQTGEHILLETTKLTAEKVGETAKELLHGVSLPDIAMNIMPKNIQKTIAVDKKNVTQNTNKKTINMSKRQIAENMRRKIERKA